METRKRKSEIARTKMHKKENAAATANAVVGCPLSGY
jgi:hypothetical protein